MQESIFEMSSNGGEVLNDSENAARLLIKEQEDVVNVIKMKGPLEPSLVLSQLWINVVPIHPHGPPPPPRASLAPAQRDLNYRWTECHLTLTVTQSPKNAHGEKIPSV